MKHTIVVTDVAMKLADSKGMKAICNVVINDMISLNDVRVIQGHGDRVFIAMPSKKMRDGKFKDCANPTNPTARKIIEDAVLAKYQEMTTLDASFLAVIN